jgi:murein DD-endopeptidase / murein LD-carboxypeptidase
MKSHKILIALVLFLAFGCKVNRNKGVQNSKKISKKYSHIMGVNTEDILNKKLYSFVDEWYGAPYKYGGKTKTGIDCSGFASALFKAVFQININGSSHTIYKQCTPVSVEELKEGDLVFFKIDSKEISHMGIFLQKNKFVHATTKAGIMINDLNEEYYKKYFIGGGRVI